MVQAAALSTWTPTSRNITIGTGTISAALIITAIVVSILGANPALLKAFATTGAITGVGTLIYFIFLKTRSSSAKTGEVEESPEVREIGMWEAIAAATDPAKKVILTQQMLDNWNQNKHKYSAELTVNQLAEACGLTFLGAGAMLKKVLLQQSLQTEQRKAVTANRIPQNMIEALIPKK